MTEELPAGPPSPVRTTSRTPSPRQDGADGATGGSGSGRESPPARPVGSATGSLPGKAAGSATEQANHAGSTATSTTTRSSTSRKASTVSAATTGSNSRSTPSRKSSSSGDTTTTCTTCSWTGSSSGTTSSGVTSSGTRRSSSVSGASGDPSLGSDSESKSEASRQSVAVVEGVLDLGRGRRKDVLYDLQEDEEGEGLEDGAKEAEASKRTPTASPAASWSGSEAEWDDEKWLQMADHYDAQRRPTTMAGWEGRKQKFPELFRSDVSICPSYSQYQVPYWSVCRRRYAASMRRINRMLAEDIEDLALLQTRALDGVRVVRCFSLGARPHPPPPDPLTSKQRRRVEQLLSGQVC